MSEARQNFQVDLGGIVDLLSHHLYSSPRVYVRELLQNAVDAITARRMIDPDADGEVAFTTADGVVTVTDSGIGLTESEAADLLATIGRSSKRTDIVESVAETRASFIGQFGIGLLSCFLIADEIRVVSRSANADDASVIEWVGRSDGSYSVRTLDPAPNDFPVGTRVELKTRPDMGEWAAPETVRELVSHFGELLPIAVTVDGVDTTAPAPVWQTSFPTAAQRTAALSTRCETVFGFTPLAAIDLDIELLGVHGVAYVTPFATSPSQQLGHRVYLKRMLLSERGAELVPEWAFFVRCEIDAVSLRPTASRESFYEDSSLIAARDAIGDQIRGWMQRSAVDNPDGFGDFMRVHHLGVKAIARYDSELLETLLPWMPFETSDGTTDLPAFARRYPSIFRTDRVEEFRQVAQIAAAQGIGVINGGYTYDAEVLDLAGDLHPEWSIQRLDPTVLTAHLDPVSSEQELRFSRVLAAGNKRLEGAACNVVLRAFQPASLAALLLEDREMRREQQRADAAEAADDLWAGLLGSIANDSARAELILNAANPTVTRLADHDDDDFIGLAVETLYGQALLMSQRPLRGTDYRSLNRSFGDLLEWASRRQV